MHRASPFEIPAVLLQLLNGIAEVLSLMDMAYLSSPSTVRKHTRRHFQQPGGFCLSEETKFWWSRAFWSLVGLILVIARCLAIERRPASFGHLFFHVVRVVNDVEYTLNQSTTPMPVSKRGVI